APRHGLDPREPATARMFFIALPLGLAQGLAIGDARRIEAAAREQQRDAVIEALVGEDLYGAFELPGGGAALLLRGGAGIFRRRRRGLVVGLLDASAAPARRPRQPLGYRAWRNRSRFGRRRALRQRRRGWR